MLVLYKLMDYTIEISKLDLREFGEFYFVNYSPLFWLRSDLVLKERFFSDFQEMLSVLDGHSVLMRLNGSVCFVFDSSNFSAEELSELEEKTEVFSGEPRL